MRILVTKGLALLLALLCSLPLWAGTLAPVPPLTAPVMDTAQMMSHEARSELNRYLQNYSSQTGSQIVVLTVDAIAPETPFDYATRVMEAWEPGRHGVDDGVLLLLVKNEHKTHLAVGRGLEGAIPDVYAKRMLDEVLRPYLRRGQADAGIQATVAQIVKLIAGEKLSPPAEENTGISGIGTALLFLVWGSNFLLKAWLGRAIGSLIVGISVLLILVLEGLALPLSLLFALGAFVLAFWIVKASYVGGGSSGGWGRGRSHSGGGGFGGGGFGGGGASGGW